VSKKVLISKYTGVQFGYDANKAATGDYEIHVVDDEPQRVSTPRKRRKPIALPKESAPTSETLTSELDELLNGLDN
jgi:hypothetical protein